MPKHVTSYSQAVWRPAAGLRLAVLHGRPENILAGVAFVTGAAITILWALRACLTVDPAEVVVQGPLRARRIPRDAIERVWAYGRGWLRIRYVAGGQTRYLTTGVTQGYLGVRLFGRETRSVRAARCINVLLGLGLEG